MVLPRMWSMELQAMDNEHDPTDQDSRTSFLDRSPSEASRQQKNSGFVV